MNTVVSTPPTPNDKTIPSNSIPHKQRPPVHPGTFALSQRKLVFLDPASEPDLSDLELPLLAFSHTPSEPAADSDRALAALATAT